MIYFCCKFSNSKLSQYKVYVIFSYRQTVEGLLSEIAKLKISYGRHFIDLRDMNYLLIVQTGNEITRLCIERIGKLKIGRYYLALNDHFDAI